MKDINPHRLTLQRAEEYGISDKNFIETIDTGNHEGPVILSSDKEETHYRGTSFTIKSVDEFKKLTGIPDEEYHNGNIEYHHQIPPICNKEIIKNIDANMAHICAAHDAYLFGDSRQVESYKEVLNKIYYPMEVTAYIVNGDIIVKPGSPLIITKQNAVITADTIIVEQGAYIQWETGGKMTANKMIMDAPVTNALVTEIEASSTPKYNYGSVGADGKNGNPGNSPGPQGQAGQGTPSASGKSSCDTAAGKGDTGATGIPGGHGNPGTAGGDSSPVNVSVQTLTGDITVTTRGGNGGNGGNGGTGGAGGQGGNGGANSSHCSSGPGGTGGPGGKGGDAGDGGNGGVGKNVMITYVTGNPNWSIEGGGSVGGAAGTQGNGGAGGAGGSGTPTGSAGANGASGGQGSNGKNGAAGQVIINGRVTPPTNNK